MLGDDGEILPEHLPDDFLEDISHAQRQHISDSVARVVAEMSRLEDVEASVIRKSLEAHGGNVSATARALGVSRNTIYRKMQH
jgi:transcriptional regulator of acetoin/glycerol metabolism